jgi:hypothetical protein
MIEIGGRIEGEYGWAVPGPKMLWLGFSKESG